MPRPRSWSDDDLRDAVEGASSIADVVRALRLRRGGAAYITVRTRMEQLGLVLGARVDGSPSSSTHPPARLAAASSRSWSESDLRDAVATSRSLNDTFTRLGLVVGGSQWLVVRSLIIERGWSTDHWIHPLGSSSGDRGQAARFRSALDSCDVQELVRQSRSRADVIRALGFTPNTTTYRLLRRHLAREGLGDEHFEPAHAAMRRARRPTRGKPLEEILVRESTYTSITVLKRRLVEEGLLESVCAECGLSRWRGEPITLHLDHVNGVRNDHRLTNLRLLCPNCHSQTDTYCGRNKGRYAGGEEGESLR